MIDIIIPVYKPTTDLFELLKRLSTQSIVVHRIILMNTERSYFDALTEGHNMQEEFPKVEVHHLPKAQFDHGGTRRAGVALSEADIFVMMTQDAMPADEYLLERLVEVLGVTETPEEAGQIAAAYARQLPAADCFEMEQYMRAFNYPAQSRVKSLADMPELGIKTFFCSNVCAAYRRDIYEQMGGFVERTIFNEDMIYAGRAVKAGYRIAYVAEAQVIHSHNYNNRQQFHRNFDLGVSQAQYADVFADVPSESEGVKLVMQTAGHLLKKGRIGQIFRLGTQTVAKYAGYFLGKNYKKLPKSWILACSDNKNYFTNV